MCLSSKFLPFFFFKSSFTLFWYLSSWKLLSIIFPVKVNTIKTPCFPGDELDMKYFDLIVLNTIQLRFFCEEGKGFSAQNTPLFYLPKLCFNFFPLECFLCLRYQTKPFIIHPHGGIDALDASWAPHFKQILMLPYFHYWSAPFAVIWTVPGNFLEWFKVGSAICASPLRPCRSLLQGEPELTQLLLAVLLSAACSSSRKMRSVS